MAPSISAPSSDEDDYREVHDAVVHDRLRDGLEAYATTRHPSHRFRYLRHSNKDLARVATNTSKGMGISPHSLADVDSRLDPASDSFDFRYWATTFIQLVREDGIERANIGVSFSDLSVFGNASTLSLQPTLASPWLTLARLPFRIRKHKASPVQILHNLHGLIERSEMLLVLGRPGSGCTTFLKSLSGDLAALTTSPNSAVCYDGIPQRDFRKNFHGKAVYNEENDEHFPHLTVEQTIRFAAAAQTPSSRIQHVDRQTFSEHMTEVMLRVFGLSEVRKTKVGNDTIRGVSGGQRKRVSIAEMALARSLLAVWDNSTRGLDSSTALDFVQSLRTLADVAGTTQAVALYQASQAIFDVFDKVLVLYEGRQVYYGPAIAACSYFERMGWDRPTRQTAPDFLTSVTDHAERKARPGYEHTIPRTAIEFEQYWQESEEFRVCLAQTKLPETSPGVSERLQALRRVHHAAQVNKARSSSPYLLSISMQIQLCMKRSSQLLQNDKSSIVALALGRVFLALVLGSIYFGPSDTTASLSSRGSVIFLATLMNALMAITEIGALFAKRSIVQRHKRYAFYHPFADALAAFIVDLPVKLAIATLFNVVYYFMAGLRLEASNFFIFLLFNCTGVVVMSAIFRAVGAASTSLPRAYAIAGIGVLMMIIYTGFTLQTSYMHPWFRWIAYINPIAYIFEALLVNEVHARDFPCAQQSLVPPYAKAGSHFACAVIGATPSSRIVSGDLWVQTGYNYTYAHIWRNLGIAFGYLIGFLILYLVAIEYISTTKMGVQRLVFRRMDDVRSVDENERDPEKGISRSAPNLNAPVVAASRTGFAEEHLEKKPPQQDAAGLSWVDLTLDISIGPESRRLLDNVSGWVKPGTLTCLMGVSGAGKTTLLDTLAQRQRGSCKVGGNVRLAGSPFKPGFARSTGYVQQQDLHLPTSTVREALMFSCNLRQSASVSASVKSTHVDYVINVLHMESFADAVVGQPGEGLNIEQRKLLTIGVELAAKPQILFLDEPTSGLDSQSAWTIISLLRRLADEGQAILATIHQPSAMLFQQFDEILLLAKGGRTTYFGPIGQDSHVLTGYFESRGARSCNSAENPAEYILSIVADTTQPWADRWLASSELAVVREALAVKPIPSSNTTIPDTEFALGVFQQFPLVVQRLVQSQWRSPAYIYAKVQFAVLASLFIGFTFFLQNSSAVGMQNVIFAIFMLNATFSTFVNQTMSRFLPQRALFEVRESPSKMYHWFVFVTANIVIEIPYQLILSVILWAAWYFPVFGLHHDSESRALMWVFCLQFLLYGYTWAQMLIFSLPSTEAAGTLSTILFTLTLQFNGVLQPPSALPGFWIFMYRVSPFTYLIGGWAGTGLAHRPVVCAQNELAAFDPPVGQSCGSYLKPYLQAGAPGTLLNPTAMFNCEYCPLRNADQFLAASWIHPSDQYRNLGIMFAYIGFNMLVAVGLYYLFRVKRISIAKLLPKKSKNAVEKTKAPAKHHQKRMPLKFWARWIWNVMRNLIG